MKYVLIGLLSAATLSINAQITQAPEAQEVTTTMSAEAKQQMQERLADIEKELARIDKTHRKETKHVLHNEDAIRDAERSKTLNEQEQAERIKQLAKVKSEINGLDLHALESKISRLESSSKRINNSSDRAERSIARKKAEIQRLQTEIMNLENDIVRNNEKVRDQEREIKQTNELITKNGLVEKQAKAESLEKEIKDLKSKHHRIDRRILKSQDAITVAESKLLNGESKKIMMLEEKQQLENLLGTGVKVIN